MAWLGVVAIVGLVLVALWTVGDWIARTRASGPGRVTALVSLAVVALLVTGTAVFLGLTATRVIT